MTPRLAAGVQAGALIRRVAGAGGTGTVIAKGDATAGAILLICCDRGEIRLLLERVAGLDGGYRWASAGPRGADVAARIDAYLARRRRADPDLWLIELDIAGVERFAAEMMAEG